MTIQESVKKGIDTLSIEALYAVWIFLLFQKYRYILEMDDSAYLSSIPGKDMFLIGMVFLFHTVLKDNSNENNINNHFFLFYYMLM